MNRLLKITIIAVLAVVVGLAFYYDTRPQHVICSDGRVIEKKDSTLFPKSFPDELYAEYVCYYFTFGGWANLSGGVMPDMGVFLLFTDSVLYTQEPGAIAFVHIDHWVGNEPQDVVMWAYITNTGGGWIIEWINETASDVFVEWLEGRVKAEDNNGMSF